MNTFGNSSTAVSAVRTDGTRSRAGLPHGDGSIHAVVVGGFYRFSKMIADSPADGSVSPFGRNIREPLYHISQGAFSHD